MASSSVFSLFYNCAVSKIGVTDPLFGLLFFAFFPINRSKPVKITILPARVHPTQSEWVEAHQKKKTTHLLA